MIRAAQMELTDRDLDRFAGEFGLSDLTSLDGYENAVFRADQPSRHILRITHTSRRTVSQIEAEMTFLHRLEAEGVPVAGPVESRTGSLAVAFDTERAGPVTAIALRFAPGSHRPQEAWTEADIRHYGEIIGGMHAVAQQMTAEPRLDRPDWDVLTLAIVEADLHGKHPAIQAAVDRTVAELRRHPAGGTDRLVHQDPHLGNLFITDEGEITLFDFDDCGYATPTYDLAMAILYWVTGRTLDDTAAEVRRLLRPFLEGYETAHPLAPDWTSGADLHMKLRELELYAALIDTDISQDWWSQAFMAQRRERIESGEPYLGRPLDEVV